MKIRGIASGVISARIVATAILASSLVACAVPQKELTSEEQRRAAVAAQIADSLSLAVNAQRELAMTQDADVQRRVMSRDRLLTDRVSYDFYGDVETILGEIAGKYGYDLKVYGKRPPEHVNVNVFVQKMQVVEVLKFVGMTAGYWIDIKIAPGAIELTYKTPRA